MAATLFTAYGAAPGQGPGGADINAEDVLDLIVDVTPWETPVVTLMPKIQATSTRHEWIEDQLGTVTARHAVSEGVAFDTAGTPTSAANSKSRVANFLQHFRYEVRVSNLQRRMNPYGIQDQYAYEVGKLVKQIGKDIEARLLEDVIIISANTFQGTESLTARMRPLSELIALEGLAGTGGIANGTKSNVRDAVTMSKVTFAGQIWDGLGGLFAANTRLTENITTKALELIHGGGGGGGTGSADTGGGHPDTMIVSPAVFGHIGAFGGVGSGAYPYPEQQFNADVNIRKVVRAVRFYDSQFGLIEVINSRYCPQAINTGVATTLVRGANPGTQEASTRNNGFVYFLERNRFRLAFARPINHVPLPPDGDSTRGMVLTDVSAELLGWRSAMVVGAINNV